ALIELAALEAKQEPLGWNLLPDDHLVALQVDRGPLDPREIGGSIALSGFPPREAALADVEALKRCWIQVAKALWNEGATLAYAGRLRFHDIDLSELLIQELGKRPLELSREETTRSQPSPRFRSFLRGFDPERARAEAEKDLDRLQPARLGVELVAAP